MDSQPQPRSESIADHGVFRVTPGGGARDPRPVTFLSLADPVVRRLAYGFVAASFLFLSIFAAAYLHFAHMIEKRMAGSVFNNAARIYARPLSLKAGDQFEEQTLIRYLRRAGYSDEENEELSLVGSYRARESTVSVKPSPEAAGVGDAAAVHFNGDRITAISTPNGSSYQGALTLEPPLITALSESQNRAKRRLVTFDQIPKDLVNAVVAIEDRRFFSHSGVNFWRLTQAAITDLLHLHRSQGGSTLTMQLSRGFFLSPEKTIQRKAAEAFIAVEMEQRYSKQRIFEMYANQVPMGQRGTFSINGFGEASHVFFNKDISKLTLPEAALLAGILQRPSHLSPFRYPERAIKRLNLVLDSMAEMAAISLGQATEAKAAPLQLATGNIAESDAPNFVDMVRDQLAKTYSESDLNTQAFRVYSTLDLDLQHAAAEAVTEGMKSVDDQLVKQRARASKNIRGNGRASSSDTVTPRAAKPFPQVALVALDPHTGEVLALVGGRNYSSSQLNHALAKRPTGSIFKPFVYAAAIGTALSGRTYPPNPDDPLAKSEPAVFTPMTRIDDSQVSISYGDETYEPRNYRETYHGFVSARYALAQSLNNATVQVAQMVGFAAVASVARAAGISSVHATPSIALGAYDATPLDMARAYTVFANQGIRVSPRLVASVHDAGGKPLREYHSDTKEVLDSRVAYVLTDMMTGVLDGGTGYAVRARGFNLPAAGKTGTSHDAWFAGYSPNLLCIIWIGNDDYTDLEMSGGATAAPIWAEFMKRAVRLPQYTKTKYFPQPPGISMTQIDRDSGKVADPACPKSYSVAFIAGTEPTDTCTPSVSASDASTSH